MNPLVEFLANKENRSVLFVGILVVVLSLGGMYYWKLLTGQVLLPQQFPLELDQGQITMISEIEDSAQFPGGYPGVGDEFNVVFFVKYDSSIYLDRFHFQISYAWNDLEYLSAYTPYNPPTGYESPMQVQVLSEKDLLGSGSSQVMVIDIYKEVGHQVPAGDATMITLRFRRLSGEETAIQWYGTDSQITYQMAADTDTIPVIGIPVTGSEILPEIMPLPACGGVDHVMCPSDEGCMDSEGNLFYPLNSDKSGVCVNFQQYDCDQQDGVLVNDVCIVKEGSSCGGFRQFPNGCEQHYTCDYSDVPEWLMDAPGVCRPTCGTILGLTCPDDTYRCVYDGDAIFPPYPDAGGVCKKSVDPREQACLDGGGIEWREFPDGCVDQCQPSGTTPMCTAAMTMGCDCGPSSCWDGTQCTNNPGVEDPHPVSWSTPQVDLTADDFYIVVNNMRFNASDATVSVHSDPGNSTYTTLEMIWNEYDRQMRLSMYFAADSNTWWLTEMRVYDGKLQPDWIRVLPSNSSYLQTTLGDSYMEQDFLFASGTAGTPERAEVHFINLNLQAFKDQSILVGLTDVPVVTMYYYGSKDNVDDKNDMIMRLLNKGSQYHGYKDPAAVPSLNYINYAELEFNDPIPVVVGTTSVDHQTVLTQHMDVCDYVDHQGVKEIWMWMYHDSNVVPIESNMAMGTNVSDLWNSPNGGYGDVSNSNRTKDLPVCENTYTVYQYNIDRSESMAIENHTHQIEHILNWVDGRDDTPSSQWGDLLFWGNFVGSDASHHILNPGCGWSHYPPNGTSDYDWRNENPVLSNCENWRPEGTTVATYYDCHTVLGDYCVDDEGLSFKVWWMQNIPGLENGLSYQDSDLRNWWDFIGDFDHAIIYGRTLTETVDTSCIRKSEGDANCDGAIDVNDFTNWFIHDGNTTGGDADFNGDGNIDVIDFTIWYVHAE